MLGKVKWFNNPKGYGFITKEDGTDIFVHYSGINMNGYKHLNDGADVKFDVSTTEKGELAVNVSRVGLWHDVNEIPDEHKPIIVLDKNGDVYDGHMWVGHAYYEFVGCDGYRSEIDIVGWKYDN